MKKQFDPDLQTDRKVSSGIRKTTVLHIEGISGKGIFALTASDGSVFAIAKAYDGYGVISIFGMVCVLDGQRGSQIIRLLEANADFEHAAAALSIDQNSGPVVIDVSKDTVPEPVRRQRIAQFLAEARLSPTPDVQIFLQMTSGEEPARQ